MIVQAATMKCFISANTEEEILDSLFTQNTSLKNEVMCWCEAEGLQMWTHEHHVSRLHQQPLV